MGMTEEDLREIEESLDTWGTDALRNRKEGLWQERKDRIEQDDYVCK